MPDHRDYKQFLRELPPDDFRRFVAAFGGESKAPDEAIAWVTSPEREKAVCEKIREVFGVAVLTAAERHESLAKAAAEATRSAAAAAQRQAVAVEEANETARQALRVAERSLTWTIVAGVVATLAFVVSLVGLLK